MTKLSTYTLIIEDEYEESTAKTIEDFSKNPSTDALVAAVNLSIDDGTIDFDTNDIRKAIMKYFAGTGDLAEIGGAVADAARNEAHDYIWQCNDSKAEDMNADHIAVDLASRARDIAAQS